MTRIRPALAVIAAATTPDERARRRRRARGGCRRAFRRATPPARVAARDFAHELAVVRQVAALALGRPFRAFEVTIAALLRGAPQSPEEDREQAAHRGRGGRRACAAPPFYSNLCVQRA